jgi:hypothetical protein
VISFDGAVQSPGRMDVSTLSGAREQLPVANATTVSARDRRRVTA